MIGSTLLAAPAMAANTIAVNPTAALNGTTFGLEVTLDPTTNNQAVVISQHPSDEKNFTVSFWFRPNTTDLCRVNNNCRVFFFRAFGNATGPFLDAIRIGLRRNNTSYRVIAWVRDLNSPNPGNWEQLNIGPDFFLNQNGTVAAKVTLEWVAATDGTSNDGSARLLKDDVEVNTISGLNNPLEVDNARIGHVTGSVISGATGSFYLDEYVSSR